MTWSGKKQILSGLFYGLSYFALRVFFCRLKVSHRLMKNRGELKINDA
jgi:hypothetical protein